METIDRLAGLDDAVSEAVKEIGESIEGYVDHRDLYLSDDTANKIFQGGEDTFTEMIFEYYPDDSDDYYSDHYEFVVNKLGLDDDQKEEHHDEIMEAIREDVYINFDYWEALDLTKVCMNIAVTSKDVDYIWGWQSLQYKEKNGKQVLTYAPDDYDEMLKVFGHTLKEYIGWYNGTLRKDRGPNFEQFMHSFNQEIENSGQGFDELVFGVKMTLREALKLKEAKSITIEPGELCGFLDTWNGGGSLLSIIPEEPVTLDLTKDNIYAYIDGYSGYGIDQIYGMSSDAWECGFTINGAEDES